MNIKPNPRQIPKTDRIKINMENAFIINIETRQLPEDIAEEFKRILRIAYKAHQAGNTGAVLCQVFLFPKDEDGEETLCFKGGFLPHSDAMRIFEQLKKPTKSTESTNATN